MKSLTLKCEESSSSLQLPILPQTHHHPHCWGCYQLTMRHSQHQPVSSSLSVFIVVFQSIRPLAQTQKSDVKLCRVSSTSVGVCRQSRYCRASCHGALVRCMIAEISQVSPMSHTLDGDTIYLGGTGVLIPFGAEWRSPNRDRHSHDVFASLILSYHNILPSTSTVAIVLSRILAN